MGAHGAVASKVLSQDLVRAVLDDWRTASINEKLRATLGFLEKVTCSPSLVTPSDVLPLLEMGIRERAIEDALLIGACFSIIARIADTLDVTIPSDEGFAYTADVLLSAGYIR